MVGMEIGKIVQLSSATPNAQLSQVYDLAETAAEKGSHHLSQQWQTTPPTEPGWYWIISNKRRSNKRYISRSIHLVTVIGGKLEVSGLHESFKVDYWLGPLPVPEPPKV